MSLDEKMTSSSALVGEVFKQDETLFKGTIWIESVRGMKFKNYWGYPTKGIGAINRLLQWVNL